MKKFLYPAVRTITLVLLGSFSLCHTTWSANNPTLSSKTKWTVQMRSLDQSLSELLYLTTANDSLDKADTKKAILKEAANLSKLSRELSSMFGEVDPDPTVKIVSEIFSKEAAHAEESFRLGHREYARRIFRSLPAYCIACHSRDNSGPQYTLGSQEKKSQKLKGLTQADYYTATRRFQDAVQTYENIIKDESFIKQYPMSWQRAVQSAVTVAVRVNQSPDDSLRIIELAQKQKNAPLYFKEQLAKWHESVNAWKKEGVNKSTSESGLFNNALKLFNKAKDEQKFPADRSGDISYLRATALIHEMLRNYPKGSKTADGLFLAGISYEVLKDPALGNLHEYFYLTCIYQFPNTSYAKNCYNRYEESVHFGFSGSGGENLPDDIVKRLEELKKLSSGPASVKQD